MHKFKKLVLAIAALATISSAAADDPRHVVPGAYLIELAPDADMSVFVEKVKVEANARIRRQIDYAPRQEQENGKPYKAVSIELEDAGKIRQIFSMASVLDVSPVEMLAIRGVSPPSKGPRRENQEFFGKRGNNQPVRRANGEKNSTARTYVAHSMMQVDKLHQKGLTGKGVKVALIDTGVDYEHPALGGCFGPGCLVSFGADLVMDELTPKDCNGHGTNVAGVLAAQLNPMGFIGAAPGVELGMYRITCEGSFPSDTMIDAIYRALNESVNIISSSSALDGGWPDSPLSRAVSRAVESGVVFVNGVGNNAEFGLFATIDPSAAHGAIGVASVMGASYAGLGIVAEYTIDNGSAVSFPLYPLQDASNFTGVPMEVYAPSVLGADDVFACRPIPDDTPDLTDKLVLLRLTNEEGCKFDTMVKEVLKRGASRIIRYRPLEEGGAVSMYPLDGNLFGVNVMGTIEFDAATEMLEALRDGRKTIVTALPPDQATGVYTEIPQKSSQGGVSYISSWGPSWDLGISPSLSAVSHWIITTAAKRTSPSDYEITDGTSMAGPLIAGIIALIIEARGFLDPATIKSLLVSHSYPQLYHDQDAFHPYLAPVAQQGGGLVRAFDAAYSTTLIQPAGLSFNDTEHRVSSLNLTIQNNGKEDITYRLSHIPAITAYAFKPNGAISTGKDVALDEISAAIALSDTNVTVAPMDTVTISVSASVPDGLVIERLPIWSGWIAINGSDGSSLSIPYQGVEGSIREHQVLPPDGTSLLYQGVPIDESTAVTLPAQGSGQTSNLSLKVTPILGVPLLHAQVVPLHSGPNTACATNTSITGQSLGQLEGFPVRWLPNNATEAHKALNYQGDDLSQHHQFKWNGRLDSGSYAPEGSYKLVVCALRIFGNPNNTDDWDVNESPSIKITYQK
ncbi:subtilisin-like protease, partial [Metarhizium majus ARSEF 297]